MMDVWDSTVSGVLRKVSIKFRQLHQTLLSFFLHVKNTKHKVKDRQHSTILSFKTAVASIHRVFLTVLPFQIILWIGIF